MANILYIAQFFSMETEAGGQGQRHYKHAKAMAEDGHQVTVLTSGKTTMDLAGSAKSSPKMGDPSKTWVHPNLQIIKLPCPPMTKRSVLFRALQYFQFSFKALIAGLQLIFNEHRNFHFVLGSSPPLLIALVAYILSVFAQAEFHMEVRDLWSQTMAANGFISNNFAIKLNYWLESFLYQKSSKIIVLSDAFCDEIENQVPGSRQKTVFIPNGADLEFFRYPKLWSGSYLNADQDYFNITFAGVFSDYTKLEIVLEAAKILKNTHPSIRFNLAGGGYQLSFLKEKAENEGLDNVYFWGVLPKNRISKFIMEGDLSLINYRNLDIYRQVLPNKIFDYLAAGRPILAAAPEGQVTNMLTGSNSGRYCTPEDPQALAEAILWFYNNQKEAIKMGVNGQRYVQKHFNRNTLIEKLLALYPQVISLEVIRESGYAHQEELQVSATSNVLPFKRRANS